MGHKHSFVLLMFITENTCSQRYIVPNIHKTFVGRDVTLVSLDKDTGRMCASSQRQTWSSNLNHTANQLFQVANQRADQRGLL